MNADNLNSKELMSNIPKLSINPKGYLQFIITEQIHCEPIKSDINYEEIRTLLELTEEDLFEANQKNKILEIKLQEIEDKYNIKNESTLLMENDKSHEVFYKKIEELTNPLVNINSKLIQLVMQACVFEFDDPLKIDNDSVERLLNDNSLSKTLLLKQLQHLDMEFNDYLTLINNCKNPKSTSLDSQHDKKLRYNSDQDAIALSELKDIKINHSHTNE